MFASYKQLIEQKYPELAIDHIEPNAIDKNKSKQQEDNILYGLGED
ncbi:hypothetical protein [Paenibacillus arenosi]|uniref:Uncharacterized protein n=1 Tax=Paenibacillus arenosi TaxID=2774142 RepID=A0ABR9AY15_9BACL|nr:hypothetical protein [Paenibacillus arenosi]MBD8498776.1 hypothetical protein [Paenibacillus arenosi]